MGIMGPTTSNSTSHDQVETPGLHDAKQVETPSTRSTEPSGEDDQVETPDQYKEMQNFWQKLLSSGPQQQQETESKKYEAVLRIQCKVRQMQANARTEKRSMSKVS